MRFRSKEILLLCISLSSVNGFWKTTEDTENEVTIEINSLSNKPRSYQTDKEFDVSYMDEIIQPLPDRQLQNANYLIKTIHKTGQPSVNSDIRKRKRNRKSDSSYSFGKNGETSKSSFQGTIKEYTNIDNTKSTSKLYNNNNRYNNNQNKNMDKSLRSDSDEESTVASVSKNVKVAMDMTSTIVRTRKRDITTFIPNKSGNNKKYASVSSRNLSKRSKIPKSKSTSSKSSVTSRLRRSRSTVSSNNKDSSSTIPSSSLSSASSAAENTFDSRSHAPIIPQGNSMLIPYQQFDSIEQLTLSDYIIVTDIEGGLHALNRLNGEVIWSLDSNKFKPLLTIVEPPKEISNVTLIVEPYGDGNIFYFNTYQGLQKLPISIRQLIMSSPMSFKSNIIIDELGTTVEDEKIYTGSRSTSMYTINLENGELISAFGYGTDNKIYKKNNDTNDTDHYITIGKTVYQLEIHSNDGTVYNVTYSSWQQNSLHCKLSSKLAKLMEDDNIFIAPSRDKSLLAIDLDFQLAKWVSPNFPGIINSVFDIFYNGVTKENKLIPHSFTTFTDDSSEVINKSNKVYLDQTEENSWFALSDKNFPSLVDAAPFANYYLNEKWRDSSIFSNDELFKSAVKGVHELVNQTFDQLSSTNYTNIGYDKNQNYYLPEKSSLFSDRDDTDNELRTFEPIVEKMDPSLENTDEDISENDNKIAIFFHNFRVMLSQHLNREFKEQTSSTILRLILKSLYRILESAFVLTVTGLIILLLQKIQLLPPMNILFRSTGLINEKDLTPLRITRTESQNEYFRYKANLIERLRKHAGTGPTLSSSTVNDDDTAIIDKDTTDTEPIDIDELILKNSILSKSSQDLKNLSSIEEITVEKKKKKKNSRNNRKGKRKTSGGSNSSETIKANTNNGLVENNPSILSGQTTEYLEFENDLKHLTVSDKILGYGSSGTVVFEGRFQNRPVAVKRMLIDFCDIASLEIKLLTESDDHANVVRYYCSERTEKFLYIALELCNSTLEDLIEAKPPFNSPNQLYDQRWNPISLLYQIASGVHHLHLLKIIHRDIKPQNILVATSQKYIQGEQIDDTNIRILISDFGLCKKLDADKSSFQTNMNNNPAGTTGWRAPELLDPSKNLILQTITEASDNQNSSSEVVSFYDPVSKQRLTRAIDIFSMGCVFYFVFSKGQHPFGERYMREANIINNKYSLNDMKKNVKERSVLITATDLITQMIDRDPLKRPSAAQVLNHPLFWAINKKLQFLLAVSDRFETERRDPPSKLLLQLEKYSKAVIPNQDWTVKFDKMFIDNLGKYRKYNGDKLMDLLRAFRNKYHHYSDIPDELAQRIGPVPDGFYNYFDKRFPNLLMGIYHMCKETLPNEPGFGEYY